MQVAVSCTLVSLAIDEVAGVTTIEVRVVAVTVTVAKPEMPSCFAVIVAVPTPVPVTKPLELTVALLSAEKSSLPGSCNSLGCYR